MRHSCVRRIEAHLGTQLIIGEKHTLFHTPDGRLRCVCLVSKTHDVARGCYHGHGYWFGLIPSQKKFLQDARDGYVALCCGSERTTLLIPASVLIPLLGKCSISRRGGRYLSWKIEIGEQNGTLLLVLMSGFKPVNVTRYLLPSTLR